MGLDCIVLNWVELVWASREAGPIFHPLQEKLFVFLEDYSVAALEGVKPDVLCRRSPRIDGSSRSSTHVEHRMLLQIVIRRFAIPKS